MRILRMFEENNDVPIKSTLAEIVGYSRLLVENHAGIVTYSTTEIQVKVSFGKICVYGTNLSFSKIARDQLIITGCIDSMQLCRR